MEENPYEGLGGGDCAPLQTGWCALGSRTHRRLSASVCSFCTRSSLACSSFFTSLSSKVAALKWRRLCPASILAAATYKEGRPHHRVLKQEQHLGCHRAGRSATAYLAGAFAALAGFLPKPPRSPQRAEVPTTAVLQAHDTATATC